MPVLVVVRSEPDRTRTRPRHRRNPVFKVRLKLSLIGLRFDVRSYFNIGRPPVEFRRDRSPSGTRTVDRSGTVFGLPSDVCRCFKIRCRAARSPSRLRISTQHGHLARPAFGIVRIRPRGWIRNEIPVNLAPLSLYIAPQIIFLDNLLPALLKFHA